MKINLNRSAGSTLMVVLVLTVIMGVSLASYLGLVSNQNVSIMRSMAWNSAVPVAEAGVEEAMAHLNKNLTNRVTDGWVLEGTNVVKERMIGQEKYKVYVSAFTDPPVITSEAQVRNPLKNEFLPKPRTVRATTLNDALFAKGMVAKGSIDMNGTGISTDSFDPDYNTLSTNGRYDPAKRNDKGDIASNSGIVGIVNVWNAEIYGKASTGPGGDIGLKNGSVGSKAWHAGGNTGIQPGWSSDDMNVQFPDVKHPYAGTGVIPLSVPSTGGYVVDGVTYDYMLVSGSYQMTSGLNLKNKKMIVTGNATLLVEGGSFEMSGNGALVIGTNASLNLYMNGAETKIAGNGIVNLSGRASQFAYWGMPNNSAVVLQGNGDFQGTIYAPNADFKLGGGGSSGDDFMGASITKTVTMGGHFKFHYDESLGRIGPRRGYTIASWNEL
jgi:hypothetical protein